MTTQDYLNAIGDYFGGSCVDFVLNHLGIDETPKIPRGERSANFVAMSLGVEIAFTDEGSLDVPSERYPDGALVLSSVRFHGSGENGFKAYDGSLPHDLSFEMGLGEASRRLGPPAFSNEFIGIYRWDLQNYCVFVDCEVGKKITQICVQLPVA